jgi:hypothetical protein
VRMLKQLWPDARPTSVQEYIDECERRIEQKCSKRRAHVRAIVEMEEQK